ncbi:MAG: PIN domain-containing protein [Bacteroidota bacterium]
MKLYLDTSVLGGYFDKEFKEDTVAFLDYARENSVNLVCSTLTEEELVNAPDRVKALAYRLIEDPTIGIGMEVIEVSHAAMQLAKIYVRQGALTQRCEADALHIAIASLHQVDALVSWNFKHMVNFVRIQMYNKINAVLGYASIDIRSPKEVIL